LWKDILIEENYEANDEGRIRDKQTKEIIPQWVGKDGYCIASLSNKLYRVHRLIALTFVDNPMNLPVVNHKNFCKTDNHIENLEWVSHRENAKHSFTSHHRDETMEKWVKKVQPLAADASKTKVAQYDLSGKLIKIYDSQKEASELTKIARSSITSCVTHKRKTAGGYKWEYWLDGSTTMREENPASPV